jgi:hypothetical protein
MEALWQAGDQHRPEQTYKESDMDGDGITSEGTGFAIYGEGIGLNGGGSVFVGRDDIRPVSL